jgi:hypothetical protein
MSFQIAQNTGNESEMLKTWNKAKRGVGRNDIVYRNEPEAFESFHNPYLINGFVLDDEKMQSLHNVLDLYVFFADWKQVRTC